MTRFSVAPEQLSQAAARIDVGEGGDGTLPSASLASAADATPLQAAWSTFLGDAIGATTALDVVSIDLSGALRLAAGNYANVNSCSAGSLREVP